MITDLIIRAFLGGINALLALLPSWSAPTAESNGSLVFGRFVAEANGILPITTMVQIASLALSLRLLMSGWDLVVFIYHQFWGSE